MQIAEVKGNVFQYARDNAECLVLWRVRGWNGLVAGLSNFVTGQTGTIVDSSPTGRPPVDPREHSRRTLNSRNCFLELTPGVGKARYLYYFPGKESMYLGRESFTKIDDTIRTMLTTLADAGVTSFAMNGIWGSNRSEEPEIYRLVLKAAQDWAVDNPEMSMAMTVVDLYGKGFLSQV